MQRRRSIFDIARIAGSLRRLCRIHTPGLCRAPAPRRGGNMQHRTRCSSSIEHKCGTGRGVCRGSSSLFLGSPGRNETWAQALVYVVVIYILRHNETGASDQRAPRCLARDSDSVFTWRGNFFFLYQGIPLSPYTSFRLRSVFQEATFF